MFVITMSLGAPRPSNTVTITLMILAFMAQAYCGVCVQEFWRASPRFQARGNGVPTLQAILQFRKVESCTVER